MIHLEKKLATTFAIIMCIVISCAIYFEKMNTSPSFLIELSAENNSTIDCFDSDLDINEEVQMIIESKYPIVVEKQIEQNYFHFDNRFCKSFYSVWQPPKLS